MPNISIIRTGDRNLKFGVGTISELLLPCVWSNVETVYLGRAYRKIKNLHCGRVKKIIYINFIVE